MRSITSSNMSKQPSSADRAAKARELLTCGWSIPAIAGECGIAVRQVYRLLNGDPGGRGKSLQEIPAVLPVAPAASPEFRVKFRIKEGSLKATPSLPAAAAPAAEIIPAANDKAKVGIKENSEKAKAFRTAATAHKEFVKAAKPSRVKGLLEDDDEPYEAFIVDRGRIPTMTGAPISSKALRVLVIGDSHDHPGLPDKSRFSWMGHHIAASNFDHVVHIGDATDANSACHWTRNDTWKARVKPTFKQDMRSLREAWTALNEPFQNLRKTPKCHITLGNHEQWFYKFEDDHPEVVGMMTGELEQIFTDAGWTHSPFGAYYMLGGIGCTHVPLSLMGRPHGGENVEKTVAMRAIFDIIFGHTHRRGLANAPKFGNHHIVKVLNVASSMPNFHVGDHARTCLNGMDYGVMEVVIQDGHIQSERFVTMVELEERYGHLVG